MNPGKKLDCGDAEDGFGVNQGDISRSFHTPHYHSALLGHLKETEPELWAWFRETLDPDQAAVEQAELELLRTTYRLDGEVHGVLCGFAPLVAGRLGLSDEVVLYQDLGAGERNARVMRLAGRIHVVFSGDFLDLLDSREQEAALAHELAHVSLHDRSDGDYQILDHLVHRAEEEEVGSDVLGETARRLRLHTEVFADRVAREVVGDRRPVISTIVKVQTGLRNVDPEAYLRQARQIIESDPSSSHGWTHPELHIRVACLAAEGTEVLDDVVTELIDGPDDLDRIDLLGQLRLQEITARSLRSASSLEALIDDDFRSYLKNYVGFEVMSHDPISDQELAPMSPSVRHLVAAILADVALVGDGHGMARMVAVSREADRQGIGAEFDKVISRATEQTLAEVRTLRRDS